MPGFPAADFWLYLLLPLAGLLGGFVNTLAGGGSMLTLPALMLLGMPADVANATNRLGVLLQSLTGLEGFNRHRLLERSSVLPVLVPVLLGALFGSLLASFLPVTLLKPALLSVMMVMALYILLQPLLPTFDGKAAQPGRLAFFGIFLAGGYGGFIQAGVGFVLIAVLTSLLGFDLKRANALKLVSTAGLSLIALAVFIPRGQVWWIPGLLLAAGTSLGAWLGVRFALTASQWQLRLGLVFMVFVSCTAAFLSP